MLAGASRCSSIQGLHIRNTRGIFQETIPDILSYSRGGHPRGKISIQERLSRISPEEVNTMREEVINLIPRLVYADPRSRLETLKDAFDVSVDAIIDKVTKLRKDIIQGHNVSDFIEENSWKYALLDEGQRTVGPHEWDPFFSKQKMPTNRDKL
ncbi:unnamed protein product [Spirodela intermedia]|uniref:Uncharacterized protein n=1 Tax=Spirodela intermedia TaxID=51605 RepID=A0A7I8IDC1_SPIIN|nr:unnamed protein product [Spirodela intermedia]CAA6655385.1 unnamed protein product [Spirodela intermedia]